MKVLPILLSAAFSVGGPPSSTHAHSWYPNECCSRRDCVQADQMMIDHLGDRIVMVGNRHIWVSKYLSPPISRWPRPHLCPGGKGRTWESLSYGDLPVHSRRELATWRRWPFLRHSF
jgi:hypothetical protein